MPKIIPIRDLKNTSEVLNLCENSTEPIFVTKNGYGAMVIMSIGVYEKTMWLADVHNKGAEAEKNIENGDCSNMDTVLSIGKRDGDSNG